MDVIITFGYPASLAAKTPAKDVPIVCSGASDPVATGLAQSLARPGGNLTGVTELAIELSAKRLEILKEAVPNSSRPCFYRLDQDALGDMAMTENEVVVQQICDVVVRLGVGKSFTAVQTILGRSNGRGWNARPIRIHS